MSYKYRVIVAGGRDFQDYALLSRTLAKHLNGRFDQLEIVSGAARGADQLGERWAREHGVPLRQFFAEWGAHGKRAGHLRNAQMAAHGTHLIAFWDGRSRGTANMIENARQCGLKTLVVRYGVQP